MNIRVCTILAAVFGAVAYSVYGNIIDPVVQIKLKVFASDANVKLRENDLKAQELTNKTQKLIDEDDCKTAKIGF